MKPTKEELTHLYVDKWMTLHELAEIFQTTQDNICDILGIPPTQEKKYRLIRKVPLTSEQKEFIVGLLLGQAFLFTSGKRKLISLSVREPIHRKELIYWKKKYLGNMVNVINRREKYFTFLLSQHTNLTYFKKLFYDNNKKVIRNELIHQLTPLAIAAWVMDAGYRKRESIRLKGKWSLEEWEKLQYMLKQKFDIRSKVCEYKPKEHYLSINKRNTQLLTKLILPYVGCLDYFCDTMII